MFNTVLLFIGVPVITVAYLNKPPISTFNIFCSEKKKDASLVSYVGTSLVNKAVKFCAVPQFYDLFVLRVATITFENTTEVYLGAFNNWVRLSK